MGLIGNGILDFRGGGLSGLSGIAGNALYTDIVLGVLPNNTLAVYPMLETSGTTIVNAKGLAARNGTYSNVTLNQADCPFGQGRVGLWNATTSYGNIYSASLAAAYNGLEGGIACWWLYLGSWTDGASRQIAALSRDDGANYQQVGKSGTNNTTVAAYRGGGTLDTINKTHSPTTWTHSVVTWSSTNDRLRYYVNNALVSTATTLGAWIGPLNASTTLIGAGKTTPLQVWHGYLAYMSIYDTEPSAADVNTLYNGGPI